MKKATLISLLGTRMNVHATTEHPDSSYGKAVLVDDNNQAYCQVSMEAPMYRIENEGRL